MNKLFALAGLGVVVWFGWKVGGVMSSDALGMALGVIFGMMAGIPAALIATSAQKSVRHDVYHHHAIAQTPQKAAGRISAVTATNRAGMGRIAESNVVSVDVGKAQKRIEVSR